MHCPPFQATPAGKENCDYKTTIHRAAQFREDIVQGLRVNDHRKSVSYLLNRYNGHLISVLNKHAPKKEKSVVVQPLQPWFTYELHRAKNERRKAERLVKDWPYRSQRNLQG